MAQYLAYSEILVEILNWNADGEMYKECKLLAHSLLDMFVDRLGPIGHCKHCHHGNDVEEEAGAGVVENVQQNERREAEDVDVL